MKTKEAKLQHRIDELEAKVKRLQEENQFKQHIIDEGMKTIPMLTAKVKWLRERIENLIEPEHEDDNE